MIPLRDANPSRSLPFVTWTLIAVNVAAFLFEFLLGEEAAGLIAGFGVVPSRVSSAPASQIGGDFSPRGIIESMMLSGEVPANKDIWLCMTCRQCTQICQFGVRFHGVVREIRPDLRKRLPPEPNHGGAPEAIERLSAMSGIKPRKQRWMTPDLKLDESSGTLLFVGCTPFFDVIFRYLRQDLLEIPRSSVRLLNASGISPRLLMDERCCGHDSYWLGDEELFEKIARLNVEAVERLGISELVAYCPEAWLLGSKSIPRWSGSSPSRSVRWRRWSPRQ